MLELGATLRSSARLVRAFSLLVFRTGGVPYRAMGFECDYILIFGLSCVFVGGVRKRGGSTPFNLNSGGSFFSVHGWANRHPRWPGFGWN